MENADEIFEEEEEFNNEILPPLPPFHPRFRSTRLQIQRSNVCSRAYFVVVMVFFHVYILNIIALLLYVHYNNGPGDLVNSESGTSTPLSEGGSSLPQPPPAELHMSDYSFSFTLPRIEGIRVGHVQRVSLVPDKTHEIKTLSLKPLLFEIPNFLTEEECRVVVQLAQLKGLMDSQTTETGQGRDDSNQPLLSLSTEEVFSLLDLNQDGLLQKQEIVSHSRSQDGTWLSPTNLRQILTGLETSSTDALTLGDFRRVFNMSQHSELQKSGKLHRNFKEKNKYTWLYQGPGSHHVLQTLRNRVTSLTHLPSSLVELSEPLQVIRYEHRDFSNAHYDSSPSHADSSCTHTRLAGNSSALTEVSCRYLTVLFYLNSVGDGGETIFPVADNRTYDEQALVQDGVDLTETQQACGKGNVRIKPTAGTALLWYNHLSNGRGWMGELDEYSLHGDCPVNRGVKWVANSWVNVDPDHLQQESYQRLVAQRHRTKSGLEEYSPSVSHSNLHQEL